MFKHIKILIVQSNKNTSIRINICFNWFWVNQPSCPREQISPWTCCSRTRWTPPCQGSETIRWFFGELLDIVWAALKCGWVKMREPFWTNILDQITNQITHLLDILDQITSSSEPLQQGRELNIRKLKSNLGVLLTFSFCTQVPLIIRIVVNITSWWWQRRWRCWWNCIYHHSSLWCHQSIEDNYHASDLLFELPGLKARKALVTPGRLGWQVELRGDNEWDKFDDNHSDTDDIKR